MNYYEIALTANMPEYKNNKPEITEIAVYKIV